VEATLMGRILVGKKNFDCISKGFSEGFSENFGVLEP
jgi:hypothetical protein